MKVFKKYIITAAVGALAALIIVCLKGIWALPFREQMGALSDGFFVPGIIITGAGLLAYAGNGGAFDMLSFAVVTLFKRRVKDYCEYRKKRPKRNGAFMLAVGAAYIVLAVVFLIIYINCARA